MNSKTLSAPFPGFLLLLLLVIIIHTIGCGPTFIGLQTAHIQPKGVNSTGVGLCYARNQHPISADDDSVLVSNEWSNNLIFITRRGLSQNVESYVSIRLVTDFNLGLKYRLFGKDSSFSKCAIGFDLSYLDLSLDKDEYFLQALTCNVPLFLSYNMNNIFSLYSIPTGSLSYRHYESKEYFTAASCAVGVVIPYTKHNKVFCEYLLRYSDESKTLGHNFSILLYLQI